MKNSAVFPTSYPHMITPLFSSLHEYYNKIDRF